MKKLFLLTAISFFVVTSQAQLYPEMITIEGGTFTMGGIEDEEKPIHSVTVSGFSMGKYEVTVAEYKAFCTASGRIMPDAPSWGDWIDNHPMIYVSSHDATAYCLWMSDKTNKKYRLPTEAEWEYAARGGNKSRGYIYAGSDDLDEVGWSSDNAGGQTQAVGRKKPNELGLYDMSGNVWEWCQDIYGHYRTGTQTNPQGAKSGSARVLRGGSWLNAAANCRVAYRGGFRPGDRYNRGGFRVVVSQ